MPLFWCMSSNLSKVDKYLSLSIIVYRLHHLSFSECKYVCFVSFFGQATMNFTYKIIGKHRPSSDIVEKKLNNECGRLIRKRRNKHFPLFIYSCKQYNFIQSKFNGSLNRQFGEWMNKRTLYTYTRIFSHPFFSSLI